jgi:hypothetical protein
MSTRDTSKEAALKRLDNRKGLTEHIDRDAVASYDGPVVAGTNKEAPQRIWAQDAQPDECDYTGGGWWDDECRSTEYPNMVEYVRADLFAALSAERDALQARNKELALDALAAHGQACDAHEAQLKAEAKLHEAEETLVRIEDITSHNMGMNAKEETVVNREARDTLAKIRSKTPNAKDPDAC